MQTKVVKFSSDGKEPVETSFETVADNLVLALNKLADNKLFTETSTIKEFKRDDRPMDEDPSVEVDERVKKYCAEKGWDVTDKYQEAMAVVFTEDPALKELYVGV
jgi:hypothetical protein